MFFALAPALRRCCAAALVLSCLPAPAQQPIQFSKPSVAHPVADPSALYPDSRSLGPATAYRAPDSPFNPSTSVTDFRGFNPIAMALAAQASARQAQKSAADRNWTLMTPEEILGIPTPAEVLGVGHLGEDPSLTPEERYLNRREQLANYRTNSPARPAAMSRIGRNPFRDALLSGDNNNSGFSGAPSFNGLSAGSRPDGASAPNPSAFWPANVGPTGDPAPKPASIWTSAFANPQPTVSADTAAAQLEGMNRFRALMDPSATLPEASATAPIKLITDVDPNLQIQPVFNPAGQTYHRIESDLARPKGLDPLTGITGPRQIADKKAPLVQPPPWLTSPQRRF